MRTPFLHLLVHKEETPCCRTMSSTFEAKFSKSTKNSSKCSAFYAFKLLEKRCEDVFYSLMMVLKDLRPFSVLLEGQTSFLSSGGLAGLPAITACEASINRTRNKSERVRESTIFSTEMIPMFTGCFWNHIRWNFWVKTVNF